MAPYQGRIHVDLGSGDGKGPYRWARQSPDRLFLATDANAEALLEIASRSERKPTRGGVANLKCVAEPMNALAAELQGVANRLTAILPWGGLLRALVSPENSSFVSLRRLCARNATLEIVFSYDWKRDAREGGPLGALRIDDSYVRGLAAAYKDAGFETTFVERISQSELRSYETTWAKRLAFGEAREIWRLRALSS